jgi:hypothetical protein
MMNSTKTEPQLLFAALKHGDADHQAWLKAAIDAFYADKPVPKCTPSSVQELAYKLADEGARVAVRSYCSAKDGWYYMTAVVIDEINYLLQRKLLEKHPTEQRFVRFTELP